MSKAVKYAEKAVVYAAKGAWVVFERLNRISPNPSFTPKWTDKPLQKSYEKRSRPWAGRAPLTRSVPSACLRFASRSSTASCLTKSCSTKRSARSRRRSSSATAKS